MGELLDIKQASLYLGVSQKTIRRKIKSGQLLSTLTNGKYLIDTAFLDILKKEMSSQSGQVDTVGQQLILEVKNLVKALVEENKKLQYELREAREETRQLTSIVFDLTDKLQKALPPPKRKKWWEFWRR